MRKKFLLPLLLGLVLNAANVAAQLPDITAVDSISYQNGVEKFIGTTVPGPGSVLQFENVGFATPAGAPFSGASYSLAVGSRFSISNVAFNATLDTLYLTINFTTPSGTSFGDYTDVLTISAGGKANPFVLPLRGRVAPFTVNPTLVVFPGPILAGETSDELPVTITTVDQDLGGFTYAFPAGSPFSVQQTGLTPGNISTISLGVTFNSPVEITAYTNFYDTLTVSHRALSAWTYKIPVSGIGSPVVWDPQVLNFGRVPEESTKTLSLTVTSLVSIEAITLIDDHFSYSEGADWSDFGGTLNVTFTPDTTRHYNAALTFSGSELDSISVLLHGERGGQPVLSASPASYSFGDVAVGTVALSNEIRVILTNPVNQLDYSAFSLAIPDGIFDIETVLPGPYINPDDTVFVTISFAPNALGNFNNALIVQADFAANLTIPLDGKAVSSSSQLAPRQATAISGTAAATTALSVKNGNIEVSGAPDGSSIRVYNLQGQSLKTQTVSSDTEILKTAAFPRSVYIVLVSKDKQEIFRQKVVL